MITFYALPELYNYVAENYAANQVDETFRISLIELLNVPLTLKPFVDRANLERLRRRFSITDSNDVFHVAAALHYGCSAIITFDHHFRQVADLIPVYEPDAFLAALK